VGCKIRYKINMNLKMKMNKKEEIKNAAQRGSKNHQNRIRKLGVDTPKTMVQVLRVE